MILFRRVLCDDGARFGCGPGQDGNVAEVEMGFADCQSRVALAKANDVGDGNFLRAEADDEADDPFMANI